MTPSERSKLPTPKKWETLDPETRGQIMSEIKLEEEHRRRMEVAELRVRVFGQVCALSTVIVLAILAWHFADRGAATEGAKIIICGAVSLVAVFVTGRIARLKQLPTAPGERPASATDET